MLARNKNSHLLNEVTDYYASKFLQHGATPRGVDWKFQKEQYLRFEQLCSMISTSRPFSINDLGCGYGALCDFLAIRYKLFIYFGIDISNSMISAAKKRRLASSKIHFTVSDKLSNLADYCIASGTFNVRLNHSNEEWQSYIETTLDMLYSKSRFGFSFNGLKQNAAKRRDFLYYCDSNELLNYCKNRYSQNVTLLQDYSLQEFTILVKKQT